MQDEVVPLTHKVVVKYWHWKNCRICGREGQEFDVLLSRLHILYGESGQDLQQACNTPKYLNVFTLLTHEVVE